MAQPPDIHSLDVVVTSDCNLRCGYCYQNAKRPGVVRWEVLRPALDLLLASRQPEVRLFFVGGEPLLAFPIIQRAVRYVESRRPRRRVAFDVSTNGVLLGRKEAAFLDEHRFSIQLSFDGVRQSQDRRGPGTFDILDRRLADLATRHPALFGARLSVAMTLSPASVSRLADSVAHMLARRIPDLGISPAYAPAERWPLSRIHALDRQFGRVYRQCLAHYRETGRVPLRLFRRPVAGVASPPPGSWYCGVGTGEALTLDVDGTLVGCVTFAPSYQRFARTSLGQALASFSIGAIDEGDLGPRIAAYGARVEASRLFNRKGRKYSSYRRCARCAIRARCTFCPACIAQDPSGVDPDRVPDFVCAFNLVAQKYRARFPRPYGARELVEGRTPMPLVVRTLLERAAALKQAAAGSSPTPAPRRSTPQHARNTETPS